MRLLRPPRSIAAVAIAAFVIPFPAAAATVQRPLPATFARIPALNHLPIPPHPPPHRVRTHPNAKGSVWTPVTATAPFGGNGAGTAMMMTDGTVMIQDNANAWYRLTPDSSGSYVDGTWSQAASLPTGYGPLYFASAILPDGKMSVEGGEYNFGQPAETRLGAIYDPVANAWSSVTAPTSWTSIGDAASVVLPNGTMMLGNCCYSNQALFGEGSLGWQLTGTKKADANSEEGWTLLPSGLVLAADVLNAPDSELYNPANGQWSTAGTIPVNLVAGAEIGPQVLRYDGSVWVAGANGHSAVYSASGQWAVGPDFPVVGGQQLDVADGPASLLPDGNVLIPASPGLYNPPAYFYEFDGTALNAVANPPDAPNDSSFNVRLVTLPTGQVLETDGSNDVEVYTPKGKTLKKLAPKVTSVPTTLTHGTTYTLSGKKLNGYSQANMYGDDVQEATNYPLVRITNDGSGAVVYAKTHGFSSMAVASKKVTSTMFDVPATIGLGASSLQVVTNGIASKAVAVTIQ
jgi:hypothetical protein